MLYQKNTVEPASHEAENYKSDKKKGTAGGALASKESGILFFHILIVLVDIYPLAIPTPAVILQGRYRIYRQQQQKGAHLSSVNGDNTVASHLITVRLGSDRRPATRTCKILPQGNPHLPPLPSSHTRAT